MYFHRAFVVFQSTLKRDLSPQSQQECGNENETYSSPASTAA